MQRQVIKLQIDVPVEVKLFSRPEGIEREGRYGPDYQYILNDDRGIMWLPRDARDQIVRSGAQPGDMLSIVKSMRGRATVFSVQIVPDAQEPAAPANGRSNFHTALVQTVTGQANGNGNAGQAAPTTAQPGSLQRPAAQWMTGALCASVDAAIAAANYAKDRGMELKFNEEDIRSMAATMYIQASKAGRI